MDNIDSLIKDLGESEKEREFLSHETIYLRTTLLRIKDWLEETLKIINEEIERGQKNNNKAGRW